MQNKFNIIAKAKIENNALYRNDEAVFSVYALDFADFVKQSYKELNINYPKFYKMDNLSKLGILCAELVLGETYDHQDVALVLSNKSGSLDTDVRHQESIQDADAFYPSPAVFVYTLANICLGEISIRHDFKSENIFLVSEEFDADTVYAQATYLLESKKATYVLCGWVELFEEKYQSVLYLVGNRNDV
ncbi:hypothetical protein [Sphingobacterium hungaricum]|uniref:3-oxoacyl-ACP synthase n=1 Tax=Sphingobacterium hungaricum TaxID=2082723 RepID=A0A928V0H4_9SPHI|nr:hypothetical protein [Sphingobacterium hungaricum]MBE8713899.1 3-oxoacyl-ACP synthase [Sphingobacterium hungaricum]